MSILIDKLNQVSSPVTQPMGFRAALGDRQKPRIQLIANIAEEKGGGLTDSVVGADAGVLTVSNMASGIKSLATMIKELPDIPCGGWVDDLSLKASEEIEKAGADFVVFPAASTSIAVLQGKKVGKILQVEASISVSLIRAIDDLPADAVLISSTTGKDHITWHDLMVFNSFSGLLDKTLLTVAPSGLGADELQAIWQSGVSGIVVNVDENIQKLRSAIDEMTFSPRRKRSRAEPVIPRTTRAVEAVADEEEEEEED